MTSNDAQARTPTRTVIDEVQIAAPVESVWRALTEADELVKWFPLEASVTPGEGGAIWLSWEDLAQWDQKIQIWEPNKHLQTTYISTAPAPTPVEIAIDFHLEAKAGGTVLRVVHSGFGADASWDTEYFGVKLGWRYELQSLQHYLEKHPGVARKVAWAKTALEVTGEQAWEMLLGADASWDTEYFGVKLGWRYELQSLQHYLEKHPGVARKVAWAKTALEVTGEQAWEMLLGADGFAAEGTVAGLRPGDRYSVKSTAGQVFSGVVRTMSPPMEFSGTVENLGDSLIRIAFEHGSPVPVALIWLATYELSQVQVDDIQASFQSLLNALFKGKS